MSGLNDSLIYRAAAGHDRDSQNEANSRDARIGGTIDRQRLAQLIADGEIPFPTRLGAEDESCLALHVAQLRRVRLIKFIARQIALHIKRNVGLTALENARDQEQLQSE